MKIIYKADDGKEFDDERECLLYEDSLSKLITYPEDKIGPFEIGRLRTICQKLIDGKQIEVVTNYGKFYFYYIDNLYRISSNFPGSDEYKDILSIILLSTFSFYESP
jgi:hypothetical protein